MSPPQQTSLTVAAPTLPSFSPANASPPVTTAPSFPISVVPTLPSPVTEAMTTEAEQKLLTPVTETVTAAPSVEVPDALPSVVAPVSGSVSTEAPVIEVEQKLTPITSTPAPVTAAPMTNGSASSTIVLTMAVNVEKLMWSNIPMIAAVTLLVHVFHYLPKATSTEIKKTIIFSLSYSLMCFLSSTTASFTLLVMNQSNIVFRYIMMLWAVTFLFGFCFVFTACFLMSTAAAA